MRAAMAGEGSAIQQHATWTGRSATRQKEQSPLVIRDEAEDNSFPPDDRVHKQDQNGDVLWASDNASPLSSSRDAVVAVAENMPAPTPPPVSLSSVTASDIGDAIVDTGTETRLPDRRMVLLVEDNPINMQVCFRLTYHSMRYIVLTLA